MTSLLQTRKEVQEKQSTQCSSEVDTDKSKSLLLYYTYFKWKKASDIALCEQHPGAKQLVSLPVTMRNFCFKFQSHNFKALWRYQKFRMLLS